MKGVKDMDTVYMLQTICVILTIIEYLSQIWKNFRTKHIKDLSWGYWICKNSINILQIVILIISGNPLSVFLSQLVGLVGCATIFIQMLVYRKEE